MSRLYLITGFLGAGKTTFLKNFIRLFAGRKIQLIINEFGQEGVDGVLLSSLGAYLNEISGGSVFCSCRLDQFENVLRKSADIDPEVILVEASGLSDPTGVRKLFSQTDRFPHIEYQGAVCLVDAVRFPKLYATARTSVKQLASSDVALVNKVDRATPRAARTDPVPHPRPAAGYAGHSDHVRRSRGGYSGYARPGAQTARGGDAADRRPDAAQADDYGRARYHALCAAKVHRDVHRGDLPRQGLRADQRGAVPRGLAVGNVVSLTPYAGEVPEEKVGHLVVLSGAGMPVKKRVKEAAAWYPDSILSID